MPLVRVDLRNEYALGAPELWREANKEDPKEVLEGVAVAGLVGVLRQLGDLAEFAAEVFHALQEEVSVTFSRSHKLVARVQRIEATLPPLEKAVLAQRSHLHFAYTAGSNWHTRIKCKQNHFVYSEVPPFIMDSYEDSHDPPRLHLLDRFDPCGPGSCLKRYSDPTFFRRASGASAESTGKISKEKKGRRIKKRSSWSINGEVSRGASFSYHSGRMHFTELNVGKHTSPTQTVFTDDPTLRSDWGDESNLNLSNKSGYIGGNFCPSYSTQPEEQESRISMSSSIKRRDSDFLDYNFLDGKIANVYDDNQVKQSMGQAGHGSSLVRYDEKTRTLEPRRQEYDHDGASREDNHDQEPLPQLFDPGTMGSHAVNFETAGKMDSQSCSNQVLPIVEPGDIHLLDVGPESVPKNYDLESVSNKAVNVETVDIMDIQACNQAVPTLASGDIHLEDAESETDDFVDALNIIEPESETDTEFAKKQKVEQHSNMEDKAVDNGLVEVIRHVAGSKPSTSESNLPGNNSSINRSCELQNPIPATPLAPPAVYSSVSQTEAKSQLNLVSVVDEALPSAQMARESMNSVSPVSVDSHENNCIDDGTNPESVSRTGSLNFTNGTSGMPIIDGTRSTPEFHKPGPVAVNVSSTMIWTNGGLLGLQPSKPPDLSGSNALPQDNYLKKDEVAGKPYETENQKIEEGPNMDTPGDGYQESGTLFRKPTWKLAPTDLDVKLGRSCDSHYPKSASSTGASATASGSEPVNSAFQAAKKHEDNFRSSSRMFDLSNRLLTSGSNKKLLPSGDQNSNPASYQNGYPYVLENCENDKYETLFGRTKELFGVDSLIESPSSSPPIQHMKILLQPIDGFETSKLKMKFSDGNGNNENSRDIFPSFQLVPEVSVARHNVASDSDDDSFYRSSPSLSDNCISHLSESNSDVWESGESPRSKDHDLYDALQRISPTEVSTVLENGSSIHGDIDRDHGFQFPVQNCINSQSCRSFVLQSSDTLNHSFREQPRINTQLKNLVDSQMAPNPVPPPLPPVQWRGMKSHEDVIEEKSAAIPEGRNQTFDVKHSESTISQQPKPAPFNHDQTFETTNLQKSKVLSSQKSNVQTEADQGKGADEKEDFLQQIRRKSFNLRPIATAKTMTPSGASANVHVTAILEKANAIRQAVGSDNGEDDSNWSDS